MKLKIKLLVIVFLCVFSGYAQDFDTSISYLKKFDIDSLESVSFKNLTKIENSYIVLQKQLIAQSTVDSVAVENIAKTNDSNKKDKILKDLLLGDFYLFKSIPEETTSFNNYVSGLNNAISIKDTILIAEASKKICRLLYKSRRALELYPIYLNIYKNYLYDENERATYLFYYFNHLGSSKQIESIQKLKESLLLAEQANNIYLQAKCNQIIGVQYDWFKKQMDTALTYYKKSKLLLERKSYQFFKNDLFGINGNIGAIYHDKNDLETAKSFFLKANAIQIPKYRYIEKVKLNEHLAKIAFKQNQLDVGFTYLKKRDETYEELSEYKKSIALNDINTKYETEKKQKENLQLKINIENEQRQKRNLLIASLFILLFGTITAFLIQKNTKRKQLLAEKEQEIQKQNVSTLLKEQELTSIDAMIEGQEKERQRIANDLHDDLGGLMANVKLHFNALKNKQSTELYDKTNLLLDEAYQKVRTIAHAKSSGVIAKQGLLKAVQKMANKVSIANNITIDVIDNGLENRLENSLELTIFRIIQELTTNIIKHAKATQATIHLTNHDNSLNIMIEDNGIGFNAKHISKDKGMGIHSIDKRVEHLEGSMTIESEINQGTTVIIDIPL